MVRGRKQVIALTLLQLTKRAHSDEGAANALDRYYKIESAGGRPEIRYSEFNGYRVIDRTPRNRPSVLTGADSQLM